MYFYDHHTKFHMVRDNTSSIIASGEKKYVFHAVTMLLFYIPHKILYIK
jgi:hypothetical protein